MLDGAGRDVVTLDMAGTLRRHKATGEVIWSSDALKRPWGPVLGMLVPLGGDMLLGSTAARTESGAAMAESCGRRRRPMVFTQNDGTASNEGQLEPPPDRLTRRPGRGTQRV